MPTTAEKTLKDLLNSNSVSLALGPNKNNPIELDHTFELNIHPGFRLKLQFGFNAANENSIIIYNNELSEILKRDNRSNGNSDWISEKNTGPTPIRLFVTAWNLNPQNNQWRQSPYKVTSQSNGLSFIQLGFEDWTDNDYDDAVLLAQTIQ
ncbi:hypothetical protein ACFOQM_11985 [Paenibacillus sp. GCM10012307]|uniref:Uncharacterized protein n=1 Tax=Paenibacillus roseus TaxID=2798579 RepID=A0A934J3A6_9BACL|nr:hypothetical protein [Paenibacillus roseus]MBJ6362010.1 hypothetical protein [Paenibacillus roseus]